MGILRACSQIEDKLVLLQDPPRDPGPDCISHSDTFGVSIIVVILFSLCVQAAEGLHFGVVPYVSRPALGIVSGMVDAGGNAGAVLTLWSIFKNDDVARTDEGFVVLGITVMVTSLLMLGIYFPKDGGLIFKAGSISYDPQRWKPPESYRGADVMDYSNINNTTTKDGAQSKTAVDSA